MTRDTRWGRFIGRIGGPVPVEPWGIAIAPHRSTYKDGHPLLWVRGTVRLPFLPTIRAGWYRRMDDETDQ